ncbi:MAG: hypothetical protein L0L22_15730, partial [Staphylococcus equorum]|nr:hypothetical protein [Staphylococcus equorum]
MITEFVEFLLLLVMTENTNNSKENLVNLNLNLVSKYFNVEKFTNNNDLEKFIFNVEAWLKNNYVFKVIFEHPPSAEELNVLKDYGIGDFMDFKSKYTNNAKKKAFPFVTDDGTTVTIFKSKEIWRAVDKEGPVILNAEETTRFELAVLNINEGNEDEESNAIVNAFDEWYKKLNKYPFFQNCVITYMGQFMGAEDLKQMEDFLQGYYKSLHLIGAEDIKEKFLKTLVGSNFNIATVKNQGSIIDMLKYLKDTDKLNTTGNFDKLFKFDTVFKGDVKNFADEISIAQNLAEKIVDQMFENPWIYIINELKKILEIVNVKYGGYFDDSSLYELTEKINKGINVNPDADDRNTVENSPVKEVFEVLKKYQIKLEKYFNSRAGKLPEKKNEKVYGDGTNKIHHAAAGEYKLSRDQKEKLIIKRIKGELTTEEMKDCYEKGYYKTGGFLHRENPMYLSIQQRFEGDTKNIGTANAIYSETLPRDIDNCVDISGVDNLSFESNMTLNDAYEASRNRVDYFTAHEIALMNFEDPYGDYDRECVELDSSMAHATETSNRVSTDGMVTTGENEAFLDTGASVNLIDKPSMLRDRKIVSDNNAMMLNHQGKWHRSRVVGNVVLNNINGKEIVIRNVWVFPGLPN